MYLIYTNLGYLVKWSIEDNNYIFGNRIQAKIFNRLCDCTRTFNRMRKVYDERIKIQIEIRK